MLDVDGDDGADSLHDLEQRYKPLPRTRSVKTGGGGMHYYFAARVRVPNSAGRLGPGLDVRGEGGYVVAPPSVHPETGRAYEWDNAPGAVESQMLPAWLRGRLTDSRPAGPVRGVSFWRELAANGVREGARNDSCARLAGHLLSRGVDPFVCLELVIAWDAHRNQPSLGASEVSQVVRSIAQREVQRWL